MANSNNIKPYADFAHKVAPMGGPEKYVKRVAEISEKIGREKGYRQGIKTGYVRGIGLTCFGTLLFGGLCYGGKKLYDKVKESQESKQKALSKELEKVEKEAVRKIEEAISEEKPGTDNEGEDQGDEGLCGFFGEEKKE